MQKQGKKLLIKKGWQRVAQRYSDVYILTKLNLWEECNEG